MTITKERPTATDLASLLLQQKEENHNSAYYLALAQAFLAATKEVEDDTE